MTGRWWLNSAVLLWLLLLCQPGWCQVELIPTAGEVVAPEQEFTVTALVENHSQEARTLPLRVSSGHAANLQRPVEVQLEPGAKKRLDLLVPRSYYYNRVTVSWGGHSSQQKFLEYRTCREEDHVFTVISPGETEFGYLQGLTGLQPSAQNPSSYKHEVFVNRPRKGFYPRRWLTYGSSDIIILYDLPNLGMESREMEAVIDWARAGGTLILASNGSHDEYRGTPFEKVAPLTLGPTVTVESLPILSSTPKPGTEAFEKLGERILVARRRLGEGAVLQLTADLAALSPYGNDRLDALWSNVVGSRGRPQELDVGLLDEPPEVPRPKAALLAWYLLAYVILVGPINLTLLKRKDKMLQAFWTVPLIAILFSGSAYLVNWVSRGHELTLREVGVAILGSGEDRASVHSKLLLFSPRSANYRLAFAPGVGLVGRDDEQLQPLLIDDKLVFDPLKMSLWAMKKLDSKGVVALEGPIVLTAEGEDFRVQNESRLNFAELVVLGPDFHAHQSNVGEGVHTLKRNASALDNFSAARLLGAQDKDEEEVVRWYVDRRRQANQTVLMGFSDSLPPQTELKGVQKSVRRHLVVVRIQP